MIYLYAGLGLMMMLPIMAGLQMAVDMGALEVGYNDHTLKQKWQEHQQALQQEIQYLDGEKLALNSILKSPNFSSFDCTLAGFSGPLAAASGYQLDPTAALVQGCVFEAQSAYDITPEHGERKARLLVERDSGGAFHVSDACLVSTAGQRCALEQELKES